MNKEDQSKIIQRYNNKEKISKIADDYGISYQHCWKILKQHNVKNRGEGRLSNKKYFFDTDYFNSVNTEEKAYWLGFLYADGCNFEKRNTVSISLAEQDKDHLKRFAESIKLSKEIRLISPKLKTKNSQLQYLIDATDPFFSKSLSKLGCGQAKTFKLKFPTEDQVPSYLINHFIRGYFDGDGSVYIILGKKIGYKPSFGIGIVGTRPFITSLNEIIKKIGINAHICTRHPERKNNIVQLSFGGNIAVEKFLYFLYKDGNIFLPRKYQKYKILLEINNIKHKKVKQIDLSGEVVKVYSSSREAAQEINGNYNCIEQQCRGTAYIYSKRNGKKVRKKELYKGFKWQYCENPFLKFYE